MKYIQSNIPGLKTSDTVMIKDNDADTRLRFKCFFFLRVNIDLAQACIYQCCLYICYVI